MDLTLFLSAFQSRFPGRAAFRRDATVVVPAPYAEIGELQVCDDEAEWTVYVGDLTHGHFESTEAVLDFLAAVFADEVEFYRRPEGGGGWRPVETGTEAGFTWSGTANPGTLSFPRGSEP